VEKVEICIENNTPTLPWHEHIRKRPGMYIGTVNSSGFAALLIELCSAKYQPSPEFSLCQFHLYGERSATITLESEAISAPELQSPLTREPIEFVLGVLAALSDRMELQLFDKNNEILLTQTFEKGVQTSDAGKVKSPSGSRLRINFQLDGQIWGNDFTFNEDFIIQQLRDLAFLVPTTRFEILYSKSGENCRTIFQFHNGLQDYLEYLSLNGLGSTRLRTAFKFETDDFVLDVAFGIRRYSVDHALLKSYTNYTYTFDDGTHVQALFQGISAGLELYFQEYALTADYDLSEENLRKTLIGGISIVLEAPAFAGATKNKLANDEIIEPIAKEVARQFLNSLKADKAAADDFIHYQLSQK
jgi:DNA gyrase/topoisomerase IV subunit B